MRFTVEPFQEHHDPEARALWDATPGVGLSEADQPQAIARFLRRNPGLSFVATHGTQVMGTMLCGHDGRRGLIHHLAVAPACRRMGVGRSLLAAGLDALRAEGIDKCHLLVFRTNHEGIAFWHALAASERTELTLFSLRTLRPL